MNADLLELQQSARRVLAASAIPADEDTTWRLLVELGWLLVLVPEELGGLGQGAAGACLLQVELGRRLAGAPFLPATLAIDTVCRSRVLLAAVGLLALAARVGYVVSQRSYDPGFATPILDCAIYVDWARALASGGGGPSGGYYLAPLYPFLLAGAFRFLGDGLTAVYALQHGAVVLAAILLGIVARRAAGEWAGIATAAIALLYHPLLFFASRPMGEAVGILALAAAVGCPEDRPLREGLASGLAALARPNLLLVPAAWIAATASASARPS